MKAKCVEYVVDLVLMIKGKEKRKEMRFLLGLLAALSLINTYPRAMEIVEIDTARDTAICVDAVGFEWEFTEPEDLEVGDLVICTMYDNGTKETILDDEIVDVVWSGYYFEGNEIKSVEGR